MLVADKPLLNRIADLYRQGLYVTAYEESRALGALTDWRGPEERLMAARLASNLGANRLGRVLHRVAYREFPHNSRVIFFKACTVCAHRGPLAGWQFMCRHGLWSTEEIDVNLCADWAALWATVWAQLRDFERADNLIAHAERLAPSHGSNYLPC